MAATTTPNATPFTDGIGPTTAGSHSGLPPTLLAPFQTAFAVNVTNRSGYPHTRPPYLKVAITYPDTDTMSAVQHGIWQCGAFYSAFGNNPSCLIALISGRLYRFVVVNRTATVTDITPVDSAGASDPNDPTLLQAWMSQGQEFLLISNGVDSNIVWDGATAFRLTAPDQLPTCCMSTYNNGRFIIALPSGFGGAPPRSYIASDLVYNRISGTPTYGYRDAILYRKDNLAILAGAAFAPPLNAGPITALFSTAIPDTSLGQGPLQVSTEGGVFSVDLPLDATLWTTTQQPSQVVSLPNDGATGQNAVANVNGDVWFRATDGIRSFVAARRDFNTWVQTALSYEMERVLPFDPQNLLTYASVVNFNNRLLGTCSPYNTLGRGIAHRGLVALDFANITSISTRSQPAWDGLWTGQPILQLIRARLNRIPRCFAFCLNGAGNICLYEIGADGSAYFDYSGVDVATECWVETGALLGKEGDLRTRVFKRLVEGQLWLASLAGPGVGTIAMSASYISDQLPCWQEWSSWSLCAPMCATPEGCAQPTKVHPQYATFLRLPQPADTCNPITSAPYRTGYYFQVKLSWAGHVEVRTLLAMAAPQPPPLPVPLCSTNTVTCQAVQCCPPPLFGYLIEHLGPGGEMEWDIDTDQPTWDDGPINPV